MERLRLIKRLIEWLIDWLKDWLIDFYKDEGPHHLQEEIKANLFRRHLQNLYSKIVWQISTKLTKASLYKKENERPPSFQGLMIGVVLGTLVKTVKLSIFFFLKKSSNLQQISRLTRIKDCPYWPPPPPHPLNLHLTLIQVKVWFATLFYFQFLFLKYSVYITFKVIIHMSPEKKPAVVRMTRVVDTCLYIVYNLWSPACIVLHTACIRLSKYTRDIAKKYTDTA